MDIVILLVGLVVLAAFLIVHLYRTLAVEVKERENLEGVIEIEKSRQEIAARPTSNADHLLDRMRSEYNDS